MALGHAAKSEECRDLRFSSSDESSEEKELYSLDGLPGLVSREARFSPLVADGLYFVMGVLVAGLYFLLCPVALPHEILPLDFLLDRLIGEHQPEHRLWLHLCTLNFFGSAWTAFFSYSRHGKIGIWMRFPQVVFFPAALTIALQFAVDVEATYGPGTWLVLYMAHCFSILLSGALIWCYLWVRDIDQPQFLRYVSFEALVLPAVQLGQTLTFCYSDALIGGHVSGHIVIQGAISVVAPIILSKWVIMSFQCVFGIYDVTAESENVRLSLRFSTYFFRELLTKFLAFDTLRRRQVVVTCGLQMFAEVLVRVVVPLRTNPTFIAWRHFGEEQLEANCCGQAEIDSSEEGDDNVPHGYRPVQHVARPAYEEELDAHAEEARSLLRSDISLHNFSEWLATPLVLMAWCAMQPEEHSLRLTAEFLGISVLFEVVTDLLCDRILRWYGVDLSGGRSPLSYVFSWACVVPVCGQMATAMLLRSW